MCTNPVTEQTMMRDLARQRAALANKCDDLKIVESYIKPGRSIGETLLDAVPCLSIAAADTVRKLLKLEGM